MEKRKRKPMTMLIAVGITVVMLFAIRMMAGCNGYRRHSNSDERIEVQLENQIRRDFSARSGVRFRDVFVRKYFGTYDEATAISIGIELRRNEDGDHRYRPGYHSVVGEIDFGYVYEDFIVIWHENNFYTLLIAFGSGIITIENLMQIRYYWQPHYRSCHDFQQYFICSICND